MFQKTLTRAARSTRRCARQHGIRSFGTLVKYQNLFKVRLKKKPERIIISPEGQGEQDVEPVDDEKDPV